MDELRTLWAIVVVENVAAAAATPIVISNDFNQEFSRIFLLPSRDKCRASLPDQIWVYSKQGATHRRRQR
jgi:hypothetical protein